MTNAVRAGEPPRRAEEQRADRSAGTINLILITNACLHCSALVCAVQVVTESKLGCYVTMPFPAGLAVPAQRERGQMPWSLLVLYGAKGHGNPTPARIPISESMIGRVTADCLTQGLARATEWAAQRRS